MRLHSTSIEGAWLIELEPRIDERGSFARTYCQQTFADHGLNTTWPQSNLSVTRHRGTIRGLHLQADPHPEIKLVSCQSGAIYDVLVDARPESPSFGRWEAFELSPHNNRSLYIPAGVAHGFQTLTDDVRVLYQMSDFYVPELATGVRWDDPAIGIRWPLPAAFLSPRDRDLPLLRRSRVAAGARLGGWSSFALPLAGALVNAGELAGCLA